MHSVDFAKRRSHLAHARHKISRQRRERDVAFLQSDALLSERQEKIALRVSIYNRLHTQLRLVHLKRRRRPNRVAASEGDEVTKHADVRIQRFGSRTTSASQTHRCGSGI